MTTAHDPADCFDLLIVGGGINGAGIARDAAGRGLRVALCDAGDFAGATSSASTKLIHGGLRYLEHYEFRLVAESLAERETLNRIARHLVRPLRFVMPHTPALRPAWMIRVGLFLYDHLGGWYDRAGELSLPGSVRVRLDAPARDYGSALRPEFRTAFVYSDLAVDDSRLVIANLKSAARLGAHMLPRTRLVAAQGRHGLWHARLAGSADGSGTELRARALINAAGPWVGEVIAASQGGCRSEGVRLVKGSHLVLSRRYAGDHAYLLQNDDRRVIFLIPYRDRYTLLGTTEQVVADTSSEDGVSDAEVAYLLAAANRYLLTPISREDIVHRFWGYRPLFDDGHSDPSAVTRDYALRVELTDGAPSINIFGGKLTTYRRLAETVIARLPADLQGTRGSWTAQAPLPGSEVAAAGGPALSERFPWLPAAYARALRERYGSEAGTVVGTAQGIGDLGRRFGDSLSEREVDFLVREEWARAADDVLWRRSKSGLEMSAAEREDFTAWFAERYAGATG